MSSVEPVIPQKRVIDDEKHQYQTRSTTTASIPNNNQDITRGDSKLSSRKDVIINKFKPIISYKPIDFENFNAPVTKSTFDPNFHIIEDIPFNTRRGFQYSPCRPNPDLPLMKFATSDLPPYNVSLSHFDRSSGTFISKDHNSVTTDRGWLSARTTIPIQEGKVYFEFNIVNSNEQSHVRIGVGRREASIEAPIGFDAYGYGLRDKTGQKIHLSRPAKFMKEGFKSGDVIGILLELPKSEFQDIIRDQIAIRYRNRLYFERFDYTPTEKMEHLLNPVTVFGEKAIPDLNPFKPYSLPKSSMKVYKNGEFVGTAFEDLYAFLPPYSEQKNNINKLNNNGTLGYYPTVSVFKGGIAEINPGPNFKFKPNDLGPNVKEFHQLYNEKIADDIVWDIVDEIEAEAIQTTIDNTASF